MKKVAKKFSNVYFLGGSLGAVLIAGFYFATPVLFSTEYIAGGIAQNIADKIAGDSDTPFEKPVIKHIPTPDVVKAIYMSQCVAGTVTFREDLVRIAETTEINSLVIDIKDFSGGIGFKTDNPALKNFVSNKCRADDIRSFITTLHEKGIYVIGRITVFQDPLMTAAHPEWAVKSLATGGVWKDHKGLSFIDVGARGHWKYIVELSKESYELGFDELNYDYIRYPSDGNMKDTVYTLSEGKSKPEKLREFFEYLHNEMKPVGAVLSADLFGMTTTSNNDLNIGQVLEKALPYFDYVAPMVYPSHYPLKWNGFGNPNHFPYEVVKAAMDGGVLKVKKFYGFLPPTVAPPPVSPVNGGVAPGTPSNNAAATEPVWKEPSPEEVSRAINKLRPWLQDFDYGGTYDIAEVRAQIKATYDAGLHSWMLWAPSNRYTIGALDKE